jgi:pantoate--beta-alanine ligase
MMRIFKSPRKIHQTLQTLQKNNKTIGFVPTMGALHDGHRSLIRKARQDHDIVVVSLYLNPSQFSAKEDLSVYPRPLTSDKTLLQMEKVDYLFLPDTKTMYPENFSTSVEVSSLSQVLCGKCRPNHFKGVATIVLKLLHIVDPDVLYLGAKDMQQAIILRKMVADLNSFVKIKLCSTIRDKNGLALSSRNVYLSSDEKQKAPVLFQSLKYVKSLIQNGERQTVRLKQKGRAMIHKSGGKVEYLEIVDATNLRSMRQVRGRVLIALAVRFHQARLIDNIMVVVK